MKLTSKRYKITRAYSRATVARFRAGVDFWIEDYAELSTDCRRLTAG